MDRKYEDELLDTLWWIATLKSILPMALRGWVNELGLYVQIRQAGKWSRLQAGGYFRSYFDAWQEGEGDWAIKKFNRQTWERRFAHLVEPTYEIADFLNGCVTARGEIDHVRLSILKEAIKHYRSVGEWVGLTRMPPLGISPTSTEQDSNIVDAIDRCPGCQSIVANEARFCSNCGQMLRPPDAATVPPSQPSQSLSPGYDTGETRTLGLDDVPWWLGWLAIPVGAVFPLGVFIYSYWAHRRGRRDGVGRLPSKEPYRLLAERVIGWSLLLLVPLVGWYSIVHLPTMCYKHGLCVGACSPDQGRVKSFISLPALSLVLGIPATAFWSLVIVGAVLLVADSSSENEGQYAPGAADRQTLVSPTSSPLSARARQPQWNVSKIMREAEEQVALSDGLKSLVIDSELTFGEQWQLELVSDMNGDGIQDAVVAYFTGGAHCCFGYYVFGSDPSGIRPLGSFGLGNASIEAVADLNGDGIPEILSFDDSLAYFPDLSFASSPFLPLVICRSSQGEYYDCTPQFPQVLTRWAQDFEKQLQDAINQGQADEAKRSAALGLLACYMRLGEDEKGWTKVQALCPQCWQWLRENSADLQERLR